MYSKLIISGKIETMTGLHIGTGNAYSAIGAADSPVIRDIKDHLPMIPGSSLKGKLRTLLARKYSASAKKPDDDSDDIKNLFGSMKKRGKLIFNDMFISRECIDELREIGVYSTTEVKFENTINRLSSVANPRQIERVIRGCVFDMQIICDVTEENDAEKNIGLLTEGMSLLQLDYLGGSGSRGYGRIAFKDLDVKCISGEISENVLDKCRSLLKGVEAE
ncbi:MAG: type III-A CRISPR-associated RAMP protein Csm3 [Ruminococcus sp.]|nr:type III-A CRISPR-associated RAMP protein Csm3 [Ruminococcus sp.]